MKHSFLFKKKKEKKERKKERKKEKKKTSKAINKLLFRLLFPQHISVFITNNVINNKEIFIVLRCEYTLRMNFTIRE